MLAKPLKRQHVMYSISKTKFKNKIIKNISRLISH